MLEIENRAIWQFDNARMGECRNDGMEELWNESIRYSCILAFNHSCIS
jgi:hypothetical protein